ncbi:MAG: hypothetical protein MJ130_06605 [Lachnospiraceae bacterium]|nr:hypothetical protein [Lachnospiraceae bacterium]
MKHSRSSILLMEMIICIFFFALCAVISSQVFVQAHMLSNKTISENHAIIVLGSLSESFYATNGDIDKIAETYFPEYADSDGEQIMLYMDKDYNFITPSVASANNYCYFAKLTAAPNVHDGTIEGNASFYAVETTLDDVVNNNVIYSIELVVNKPATLSSPN